MNLLISNQPCAGRSNSLPLELALGRKLLIEMPAAVRRSINRRGKFGDLQSETCAKVARVTEVF
jgi:hypothetical protein